jgi:hypothetical protein
MGHLRERRRALSLLTSPWSCSVAGAPNSRHSGRSLLILVERMQKSWQMDWLLLGPLTLLGISLLGFAYILWQTYTTVSR